MTKEEQRSLALAARRAMGEAERAAASSSICRQLLTMVQVQRAKTLLSYMALYDEVDLHAVNEALAARGVRLVFPVCFPHGRMEVYEPRGWQIGPYGIREPDRSISVPAAPEEIDAALIPCVAFDVNHNRLGHGAGYYDRYLSRCENAARIAVAFACQELPLIVCEAHDRRMDAVITEKAIY